MELCVLFAGLTGLAVEDWRKREVSLLVIGGFAGMGVLMAMGRCLLQQNGGLLVRALCGVLPGFLLLGVAHLTKGAIGEGDGWMLAMIGLYLGAGNALLLLWLSSFFVMLVGCVVVIRKRGNGKTRVPWAPFAWVAYVILWIGGVL